VAVYGRNFENYEQTENNCLPEPSCGWSNGVRAVLKKYDLPYEDRDIINDPAQRQEMIEKSGQMLSPCVEISGRMLADVSGEEVEAYLLANKLVAPNERAPDAPPTSPARTKCREARAFSSFKNSIGVSLD